MFRATRLKRFIGWLSSLHACTGKAADSSKGLFSWGIIWLGCSHDLRKGTKDLFFFRAAGLKCSKSPLRSHPKEKETPGTSHGVRAMKSASLHLVPRVPERKTRVPPSRMCNQEPEGAPLTFAYMLRNNNNSFVNVLSSTWPDVLETNYKHLLLFTLMRYNFNG